MSKNGFQRLAVVALGLLAIGAVALALALSRDPDLALFDTSVVIDVGGYPTHVVASPAGERVYVTDYQTSGTGSRVVVIDLLSRRMVNSITLPDGHPNQAAVTPDGKSVLVAMSTRLDRRRTIGPAYLARIDTTTAGVTRLTVSGSGATGLGVLDSNERAVVTDRFASDVQVVNLTDGNNVRTHDVAERPFYVTVNRDSTRAYIPTLGGARRSVSAISTVDGSLDVIPVDLSPSKVVAFATLSPDEKRLYVTHSDDSRIAVVDTDPQSDSFHRQIATLDFGKGSLWKLAFHPEGQIAAVISRERNELLVIDTRAGSRTYHELLKTIALHESAVYIVFQATRDGIVAVVSNSGDGTVQIFGP